MPDSMLEQARLLSAEIDHRIRTLEQQANLLRAQKANVDSFVTRWTELQALAERMSFHAGGFGRLWDASMHQQRHSDQSPPFLVGSDGSADTNDAPRPRTNSKKEEVAAAARALLLERGKPISKGEMHEVLTQRGLVIEGQDPEKAMNTMFWRTRDDPEAGIIHLRGVGYWLRDKALPGSESRVHDDILGDEDDGPHHEEDAPEAPHAPSTIDAVDRGPRIPDQGPRIPDEEPPPAPPTPGALAAQRRRILEEQEHEEEEEEEDAETPARQGTVFE